MNSVEDHLEAAWDLIDDKLSDIIINAYFPDTRPAIYTDFTYKYFAEAKAPEDGDNTELTIIELSTELMLEEDDKVLLTISQNPNGTWGEHNLELNALLGRRELVERAMYTATD